MRCLPKTGSYTLAYTSYQGQKLSQASITWCLYPSFGHFVDLESVKGSGNFAFLQKDHLCYLKRAEKLTFCIYYS